jgi:hypothetical protein
MPKWYGLQGLIIIIFIQVQLATGVACANRRATNVVALPPALLYCTFQ